MIELYYWPTANGLKVAILLEELAVEYTPVPINIRQGQQHTAAYQQISASGRIPALIDMQQQTPLKLFESGAILTYLASQYQTQQAFLPALNSAAFYQVQQWLFWQAGHITPYLSQLQLFKEKAPAPIEFALSQLSHEAQRLYQVLEAQLSQQDYIAGQYSIADMAIFPWIQASRQGFNLADYPAIAAWRERIKARPAVQRAYANGRAIAAGEKSLVVE